MVFGNPISAKPVLTSSKYSAVGHLQKLLLKENNALATLLMVLTAVALPISNRLHTDLK